MCELKVQIKNQKIKDFLSEQHDNAPSLNDVWCITG